MNVEIGTEAPIFLFWEYLFQIFGILSLQCRQAKGRRIKVEFCNLPFLTRSVFDFLNKATPQRNFSRHKMAADFLRFCQALQGMCTVNLCS